MYYNKMREGHTIWENILSWKRPNQNQNQVVGKIATAGEGQTEKYRERRKSLVSKRGGQKQQATPI